MIEADAQKHLAALLREYGESTANLTQLLKELSPRKKPLTLCDNYCYGIGANKGENKMTREQILQWLGK